MIKKTEISIEEDQSVEDEEKGNEDHRRKGV